MTQNKISAAELKAYKRMVKTALKPENMTATLIRCFADCNRAYNFKPNYINKKLRAAVERAAPSDDWRKKAWENLQATIFRKTPTDPKEDQFYKYGKATAQLDNLLHGLDKIMFSSPEFPSISKIFKPFLPLDKEEQRQTKKSLRHFAKCLKNVEAAKPKLPPSQKELIAKGEAKGAQAVYDDNGSYIHKTDATMIYIALISLGEIVDQFPSRKAIFRFLKEVMGQDMPHDEEAFTLICKRIGLKGTKGREREKKNARVIAKKA